MSSSGYNETMFDFSFISPFINFFNEQPFYVLCFLYLLHYYKDLKPIKVSLTNHITDTNKKIDKLEIELKTDIKDLKVDIKDLKEDFKNLDSKLDSKFDNIQNILLSNKV